MADLKSIHHILCRDNGLAALCSQNGWIDNATIWFEIEHCAGPDALVSVYFDEVITKGGGCVAKRQPCWGRVWIDTEPGDDRVRPA